MTWWSTMQWCETGINMRSVEQHERVWWYLKKTKHPTTTNHPYWLELQNGHSSMNKMKRILSDTAADWWFVMCWQNEASHKRSESTTSIQPGSANTVTGYLKTRAVSEYSLKSPSSPKQQESGTGQRQQRQALIQSRQERALGVCGDCQTVLLLSGSTNHLAAIFLNALATAG